jgi:hypothetical protein
MTRKRKFHWKYFITFLSILAFAPASAAASGAPTSMQEAIEIGDPAATDPVLDASGVFVYKGDKITGDYAVKHELLCHQTKTENLCFDTEKELVKSTSGVTANSIDCAYNYLFEWRDPNKGGGGYTLAADNVWANYAAANDQETSSFQTGVLRAIFAGHIDGGGLWYPGASGYCYYKDSLVGTGWDDRFRSRRRY